MVSPHCASRQDGILTHVKHYSAMFKKTPFLSPCLHRAQARVKGLACRSRDASLSLSMTDNSNFALSINVNNG